MDFTRREIIAGGLAAVGCGLAARGGIVRSSIAGRQSMTTSDTGHIPLPDGVVAVEYIETTDESQYIDLGYVVNSSEIVCSVSYMRTNSNGFAFAGFGGYGNGLNFYLYSGNGCVLIYGRKVYNLWDGNFGGVNEIVNVTFGNGIATARNINRDYAITSELADYDFSGNSRSFWVFKSNGAGFATPIGLRFLGAKIDGFGDSICNLIPVRITSAEGDDDGAIYDIVRGEVLTKNGSGNFLIGPDL